MKIKRAGPVILLRVCLGLLFIMVAHSGSTEITPARLALASGSTTATQTFFLPLIQKNYPPAYTFTLQPGSPAYLSNFANPNGCNWLGIAGQAFNSSGQSIVGIIVHLEGDGLNQDALTGSKPVYGVGGYEHYLNDHVIAATYSVQLRNASVDLSPVYQIPTFADCNKNLVLVNFIQVP